MKVFVNGKERTFDEGMTLSKMISALNLNVMGMIIERNLEVVSKSEYDKMVLKNGDKVELIRLVGGG